MFPTRFTMSLYLLSLLLIGVGYIAIMPPFEGFDEPAHYASLRQIADTLTIPLFGKSYLPKDVADYSGPMAYSSLHPPFDSGLTYAKFFADPAAVARFLRDYRQPQPRPSFIASGAPNWEAQHPPLYYVMLAPVLRLAETAPFVSQILVLRIVSYALALAGVFFGLKAIPNAIPNSGAITGPAAAATGFLLYPVMLPMFFPEFARIGNDSLCLLLAGLAAFVLTKMFANERKLVWPLALGACLGLGLLTKAFFLPITFAIGVFLLVQCWRSGDGTVRRLRLRNGAVILVIAVLIGGGWYVYDALFNGVVIGGDDSVVRHSGFWTGVAHNLSIVDLARGATVTFVTWIWAGTWSLVRMPLSLYVPLALLMALMIGAAAVQLRRAPLGDPLWLTVLLFAVFAAGLLYHVVLVAANGGEGGTAGWYFHILMPWTAPALGLGIAALTDRAWTRWLLAGLLGYAVLFQAMAVWSQFALFTGCAIKDADKYYSFSGHLFCLDQTPTLFGRLAVIGWPVLAIIGFGGGLFCAAWLALAMQRRAKPHEQA
jgi:hypothetical protein